MTLMIQIQLKIGAIVCFVIHISKLWAMLKRQTGTKG